DNSPQGQMALDSQGRPTVAWVHEERDAGGEVVAASFIYVERWNGAAWEELGGSATGLGLSPSRGHDHDVALVIDRQDRPVVAWQARGELPVRRWTGRGWQELGAGSAAPAGITASRKATEPAVVATGARTCVAWRHDLDMVYVRCFTEREPTCACDATFAC